MTKRIPIPDHISLMLFKLKPGPIDVMGLKLMNRMFNYGDDGDKFQILTRAPAAESPWKFYLLHDVCDAGKNRVGGQVEGDLAAFQRDVTLIRMAV